MELPDNWLDNGNVWEMPVMEDACEVHFNGYVDQVTENGVQKFIHRDYRHRWKPFPMICPLWAMTPLR